MRGKCIGEHIKVDRAAIFIMIPGTIVMVLEIINLTIFPSFEIILKYLCIYIFDSPDLRVPLLWVAYIPERDKLIFKISQDALNYQT